MKLNVSDIRRLRALERELAPDADAAQRPGRVLRAAALPAAAVLAAALIAAVVTPRPSAEPPQIETVGLGSANLASVADTDRILEEHADVLLAEHAVRVAERKERPRYWFDDHELLHYQPPWAPPAPGDEH